MSDAPARADTARPDAARLRVPPHSIEAEESLLGAMLLSEQAISAVTNVVTAEDFYRPAHRHIFDAIQGLYGAGQGVDPVTVADELNQAGVLDAVGGSGTLITLQARTPAITNALHYAKIVEEKALLRRLIITANDVAELGYQPLDDIEKTIDSAESMMFAVAQRRNTDSMAALAPLLDASLEQLEQLYERGDAITGTPTGYIDLDAQLAGLQPGALIVVGARPAMGKCLAWDSPLVDPTTGEVRTIADGYRRGKLGAGDAVFSLGEDLRLRTSTPSDHIDDGQKPVFRVTTALGRTVRCTLTHPFRTLGGWQPLSELSVGDRIAVPRELPVFGDRPLPEAEVSLLGLLLGDGTLPEVPSEVFTLPREQLAQVVRQVSDTSGWRRTLGGHEQIGFAAIHESVARSLQHVLVRFGVLATLRSQALPGRGERRGWQLVVDEPSSVARVAELLGSDALVGAATRGASAETFVSTADVSSDVWWDRIVSIEFDGIDQVYDLTVPGDHNFVAADLFVHNTAFSLGLAAHAAVREQRPVLFFSLEMGHLELTQRLIAAEARLDATKLRTGRLTDADWTKITKAMGRLGEGQLWIDDNPALTVTEIRSKARRLQDRLDEPLGLIIVDYLQLMSGRGSAESRQVEVSEISRGLKVLARELETPVMALSQLSRQLEQRADKRPMLADLRESGCLIAETRILRADTNTEVTLGELLASGERDVPVWSLGDDWKLAPATMTHAFPSGTKEVFRLRMASGREVTATANHPFRTVLGWSRLDELVVGSRIATPRAVGAPEQLHHLDPAEIVSLAASSVRAGAIDPAVFSLADDQLAAVLAQVFGAIGSLGVGTLRGRPHVRLTATSVHRRLIDDVQLLLARFGVLCRITDVGPNKPRWRLWIHGADHQRRLLTLVGVAGERGAKVDEAIEALSQVESNPNVDTIPCEVRELVVAELDRAEMTQRGLAAALGEQYCGGYLLGTEARPRCSSRSRLDRIAQATDSKELAAIANSDVFWDEVVEITSVGEREVYDATVLGTHNFVANGIVVHNSIEQDADVVMFLYRDEVYNSDSADKDTAEVIVAKHRAGPTGTTRLVFLDYCTLFTNMAREG